MKIFEDKTNIKMLTASWVILLLLTLTAGLLSQLNMSSLSLLLLALTITIFKSQLVVDIFMGLKTVAYHWRYLMLAYIVLIPVIIVIIYLTAAS
jgi:cytochrome c oxidase subunit IV